ncbi:uncharacterized PE-PGRS family protein PE_PGRS20-like [Octopus bimaculoides]|uniref:uncharacterized PE-PGRS family protein PE_PGRS20-like n=1 Tax=Octopus bimaculoides TaxID=37653 RepID=UPI00071CF72F|nr:uncharacterized PE-PGRS family protein PE_PGRS20-like [Octopus bimaculoides]|eukprot:XP_014777760.1 PREDICTED: uncharacterized PE-PGRS family protein PE_PGRS20-like [Octopus bimaculoides]
MALVVLMVMLATMISVSANGAGFGGAVAGISALVGGDNDVGDVHRVGHVRGDGGSGGSGGSGVSGGNACDGVGENAGVGDDGGGVGDSVGNGAGGYAFKLINIVSNVSISSVVDNFFLASMLKVPL